MSAQTYSHDAAFAALCIMEEMIDSSLGVAAPRPWGEYWSQNGVNEMRSLALELAPHADAAWQAAYARYQDAEDVTNITDPGSFDYDFIPVWLPHAVDWPQAAPWDRPRVRNPQILADKLAAEVEPVRSSDDLSAGALACPSCGDSAHLYDRADVRYDPHLLEWVVGDCEGAIDCTECDWGGPESELARVS